MKTRHSFFFVVVVVVVVVVVAVLVACTRSFIQEIPAISCSNKKEQVLLIDKRSNAPGTKKRVPRTTSEYSSA